MAPNFIKFIGFGDTDGPTPYKFIRPGDSYGRKPCTFIRFGDSYGPKLYKGDSYGRKPYRYGLVIAMATHRINLQSLVIAILWHQTF